MKTQRTNDMADPRPRKRLRRLVVEESSQDGDTDADNGIGSGDAQKDGRADKVGDEDAVSPRRKRATARSAMVTATATGAGAGIAGGKGTGKVQTRLDGQLSPSSSRTKSRGIGVGPGTTRARSATTTPTPSPEKLRSGKVRGKVTTGGTKSGNGNPGVRAFFKPATKEQRWDRGQRMLNSGGGGSGGSNGGIGGAGGFGWEDEDDSIEDDGVDEIFAGMLGRITGGGGDSYVEKRELGSKNKLSKTSGRSIGPGKKFLLPTSHRPPGFGATNGVPPSSSSLSTVQSAGSAKPWPEEFAPTSLEELAVHKRKVADVQNWLADVFSGKSRRVCLLIYDLVSPLTSIEDPRAQGSCRQREDDHRFPTVENSRVRYRRMEELG